MILLDTHPYLKQAFEHPNKLIIWTGAGISKESGLPLGDELTEAILDELAKESGYLASKNMRNIYSMFYPDGSRELPRLEFILDKFEWLQSDMKLVPEKTLERLMDNLFGQSSPNAAHLWISKQISRGAKVVTANFDTLIEDCLKTSPSEYKVLHYHGLYSKADECGAILRKIALGLSDKYQKSLDNLLTKSEYVIFIGYSGRDYYDILPFFAKHHSINSQFKKAIWLSFEDGKDFQSCHDKNKAPPDEIKNAFKEFVCFKGDCRKYYGDPVSSQSADWKSELEDILNDLPKDSRIVLSLEILRNIGLLSSAHPEVKELYSKNRKEFSDKSLQCIQRIEARILVGIGLYRDFDFDKNHYTWQRHSQPLSKTTRQWMVASAAFSGLRLCHVISVLPRSVRTCAKFDKLLADAKENEDYRLIHERLHILTRLPDKMLKIFCIFNLIPFKWFNNPRWQLSNVRYSLLDKYEKICKSNHFSPDIELLESLRAELRQTENEVMKWVETDNLPQASIVRRKRAEMRLLKIGEISSNNFCDWKSEVYSILEQCGIEIMLMRSIGSYYIAARWCDLELACYKLLESEISNHRKELYSKIQFGRFGKIVTYLKLRRVIKGTVRTNRFRLKESADETGKEKASNDCKIIAGIDKASGKHPERGSCIASP